MKRTAILFDGGFFVKRIEYFLRKYFGNTELSAGDLCKVLNQIARQHVQDLTDTRGAQPHTLYRIYFYDCPPLNKQVRYPLPDSGNKTPSTWNTIKHPPYLLRTELHKLLKKNRKTALRLGVLSNQGNWQLTAGALGELVSGVRKWDDITKDDFYYEVKQKMVDTKLGVDITALAIEKLVDTIVLVAGDSDFIPAAKLARQKGIDFLLDPMWSKTTPGLTEHVDGVQSYDVVSIIKTITGNEPDVRPTWWKN
ncbi:TPA: NYN domain-containing protein [Pseudomonas aeruginosa]|uniref:NYN domain-containing protein n=1 Tax=Pseudomonas aeruginosa TaxID=287 RepID=UPI003EE3D844|nr:NYN domain-containing protein [Pseudomonas aeruginosa]HBN9886208.1 NYN domain-containing protein [Pseudomonas aeruginosa]HBP1199004.1 NYN domain-containing protein [Pseudomonas aeruginosa]HCF6377281.1 NYN domain-containing protein [Pseudomonas aeruginosa]